MLQNTESIANGNRGATFDEVTNHVVHVVPVAPEPTPSPAAGPSPHPPPKIAAATTGEPLAGPSSTLEVRTMSDAGAPSGANRAGDAFPTDSSGNVSSSETLGGSSSPSVQRTPRPPPLAGLRRPLSQQSCREASAAPTRP